MTPHLELSTPSSWVQRFAHLVKPLASVLDVASGSGRHSKLFADKSCKVTAIDLSAQALAILKSHSSSVQTIQVDIENAAWPLVADDKPQIFDVIVVTNYLHRPLIPTLLASLADGGMLFYETFAVGNETVGKPSRHDFLLKRGELLFLCSGLQVIAFEDGFLTSPDRFVQRIVATKMHGSVQLEQPPRYLI